MSAYAKEQRLKSLAGGEGGEGGLTPTRTKEN